MTAPLIAAGTIGTAIVLVWLTRPAPESIDVPDEGVAKRAPSLLETAAPTEPTQSTAEEVGDASAPTAEAAAAPNTLATPPAPLPGETPVMPMAQLLESAQLRVAPALAQMERDFAVESVDASWAPRAEADILSKFTDMPGLALLALQVECRSTMCRVQAASRRSSDGFNILIDSIDLEARFKIAIIDPSDALQSVAYVERQDTNSD